MDSNYLKHAIGPNLNAALASLLSHPHPTQVTDPIHHIARHLLHQDTTKNNKAADQKHLDSVLQIVDAEKNRVRRIEDTKKRIGMQLDEGIALLAHRAAQRIALEEASKRAAEEAIALKEAEAAAALEAAQFLEQQLKEQAEISDAAGVQPIELVEEEITE
ncbi:hypothetical protein HDU98_006472 [Podochytrium sp. JEL0797]|nr:hypothetical protein HDU98_006472 [Podochytrium sp. JEL0797]